MKRDPIPRPLCQGEGEKKRQELPQPDALPSRERGGRKTLSVSPSASSGQALYKGRRYVAYAHLQLPTKA